MRKTLIIFILATWHLTYSQKPTNYDLAKIRNETLYVVQGYENEYDEVIKTAIDTYWKLNQNIKYIKQNELESLKKNGTCKLFIGFEGSGTLQYGKKYTITTWGLFRNSSYWTADYTFQLDNLTTSDGEVLGTDKDLRVFSNRVIQYIKLIQSQYKRYEDLGWKNYVRKQDMREKFKDMTVLVPKEYIDYGISESLIKEYLPKYEIISTDDIKKKVIDDKNLDNVAQLFLSRGLDNTLAYIVELKTGDLISVEADGERGSFGIARKLNDDDVKSLLKRLKKGT